MSFAQILCRLGAPAFLPAFASSDSRRQGCRRSQGRFVLPTALAFLALLGKSAYTQSLLTYEPLSGPEAFWSAPALTNVIKIGYGAIGSTPSASISSPVLLIPNTAVAQPGLGAQAQSFVAPFASMPGTLVKKLFSSTYPPPGVYKTTPYTCIVVVPGPNADDKCIIRGGNTDLRMIATEPPLTFIPYRRK